MSLALLIDFGSTYTKVMAVDLETERSIGRAQAPSTVDTDVLQGLLRALELLKARVNLDNVSLKLASSSAAGGLRMVAVGLIARLTSEAANRAARPLKPRRRPSAPARLGGRTADPCSWHCLSS